MFDAYVASVTLDLAAPPGPPCLRGLWCQDLESRRDGAVDESRRGPQFAVFDGAFHVAFGYQVGQIYIDQVLAHGFQEPLAALLFIDSRWASVNPDSLSHRR
jgi:hypothetical protein